MTNIPAVCQNCKQDFVIDERDQAFYASMAVPPPTFCATCRFQRRMMFRNERTLYRRTCDLCGASMLTVYAPDKPYTVYCNPCWWSDKWDARDYARDHDPSRSFFEQFQELHRTVPLMPLMVSYLQFVNSEYVNHAGHLKNCYLIFDADVCEDVYYGRVLANNKDCLDLTNVVETELSSNCVSCTKCFTTHYSEDCNDCHDILFSKQLSGCSNCYGCINLRNKQYCFKNEQLSKAVYEQRVAALRLDTHEGVQRALEDTHVFFVAQPHRYMHGKLAVNATGDYIFDSKNTADSFMVRNCEDVRYCQQLTVATSKDCYDYSEWGNGAERMYECMTVGEQASNVRFSACCWPNNVDIEYSMYCGGSSNIFGCVGLKKQAYRILNKEYSAEEYAKLREQIIADMNQRPYTDSMGRMFRYGEFFPYDLSPYGYNETSAQDYFPLSEPAILEAGWKHYAAPKSPRVSMKSVQDMPDAIGDVPDSICEAVFACPDCGKAFRIIKQELALLRRFGMPLPHSCWECRIRERQQKINPPHLYQRTCGRCMKRVSTSYGPDRPEPVWCDTCFDAEAMQ